MKTVTQHLKAKWLMAFFFLVLFVFSCDKEEDGFPITNDLRVLQVRQGTKTISSGSEGIPVLSSFQFIFSHQLDVSKFEADLSISPAQPYVLTYDDTKSFVTVTFTGPLQYATPYTVSLPQGAYGANGESLKDPVNFIFTTQVFNPPTLTLTASSSTFYEGESVTLTAQIAEVIFSDVSFTLQFEGTAQSNGIDYTVSETLLTIPAGSTSTSITLTAINGDETEGTETIIITATNLVNAIQAPAQAVNLLLGDATPALELKGILSLKIGGTTTNGRAIHLKAIEDIADLSVYGIGIANNGEGSDGREIDFPAISVSAGEDILLHRDVDEAGLSTYLGACFSEFEHVIPSTGINFNGDDAVELFLNSVVIETYGEITFTLVGEWAYTGSWAYKLGGEWIYAKEDCSAGSVATQTSACVYPMCSEGLEFLGILSLNPTAGRIRAFHLRALKDIDDLSIFTTRIAANGAASFGDAIAFPVQEVKEGEVILLVRDLDASRAADYFGSCYSQFDHVITTGGVTSNGNDAIGLFKNGNLIETYGVVGVDGLGQSWDYTDSWAYKAGGAWTYAGAGCTVGAANNASSSCPYSFCQ